MGRRPAAVAPVAVSLLAHGAAVAAVLLAIGVARDAPRPAVVPVARVAEPGHPLLLEDAAGPAIPLDTDDPRYRPYLSGVRERIASRWSAAPSPRGAAAGPGAVVEFVIAGDGSLAASEAAVGGAPEQAAAALGAVRAAAPFPPLPPQMGRERLRVRARFVP